MADLGDAVPVQADEGWSESGLVGKAIAVGAALGETVAEDTVAGEVVVGGLGARRVGTREVDAERGSGE